MAMTNPSQNNSPEFLSLYLHVPFCGTRCTYCAFNTYTNAEALIAPYVAALCQELRQLGRTMNAQAVPIHTIYFGGGTPSLLEAQQVAQILDTCRTVFELTPDLEVTLEANPGSVENSTLNQLRDLGVNRLSIGMQSAQAADLKLFARQHDTAATAEAVAGARRAGFENVNLDLIFGAPYQTLDGWRETVQTTLALAPDHLSMYALILEAGTPLARSIEGGTLPAPDDDLAADMYDLADVMARDAGLIQYEISNWARPGAECLHNLQYWRNKPYLGVGAGAHGYAAGIRYEIVRPIQRYIDLVRLGQEPLPFPLTSTVERHEKIDQAGAMAEHMMTGLRLVREGVSMEGFRQRFGAPIGDVYGEAIDQLTGYDLLRQEGDRLTLTPRARLLSNQVFVQFMWG